MTTKNNQEILTNLPELEVSLSELQCYVASAPARKPTTLRNSVLALFIFAIGTGIYFSFGNKTENKKEASKNIQSHKEQLLVQTIPLISSTISKNEGTKKQRVAGMSSHKSKKFNKLQDASFLLATMSIVKPVNFLTYDPRMLPSGAAEIQGLLTTFNPHSETIIQ